MYGHGMNGWGYAFMALGTLGFWTLVAIAAVALVRRRPAAGPHVPGPSPQQLLASGSRAARSDDDEYYRGLGTLEQGEPPHKTR